MGRFWAAVPGRGSHRFCKKTWCIDRLDAVLGAMRFRAGADHGNALFVDQPLELELQGAGIVATSGSCDDSASVT